MQRNVDKIIENVKLNRRYDMTQDEACHLLTSRRNEFSLLRASFLLGYARGMKAQVSESRGNSYE